MTLHRRDHQGHAIAEVQNRVTYLADAPTLAADVIPVPGIKEVDTLLTVLATATGGLLAQTEHAANCSIFEPRATALLDGNNVNPSVDDTVTIGDKVFTFKAGTFDDNYPVGSNQSPRLRTVLIAGTDDATMANLVAAINYAFDREVDGVTAVLVNTDDVQIFAKETQAAGVGIPVAESGWAVGGGWFDLEAVPAATTTTKLITTEAEGITCTDDLTGAQATGGIEVQYRVHENEEPIDVSAQHTGNYGPGDPAYDSAAGDPGNVGYGPGRLAPGWTP